LLFALPVLLQITLNDLNRQKTLFGQGHNPVNRIEAPNGTFGKWHRGCKDT